MANSWNAQGCLMNKTFSQILSEYHGFEKAFWATYSVNFSTLDFLIKKDFKQVMNPHYLHLICDGNQLDESIAKVNEDNKNLLKLLKLQEYCTISPQLTDGAFHPKILLFTSKTKLLFIVSSANATPSGILSNQDLISTFYYDEEHLENMYEVVSLFQYLRSFDGWGDEAREDLNIIEEDFNFLKDDLTSDNILTIPGNEPLISKIIKGLPNDKIQHVNIFSPFFDDNYSAITHIADYFKVPVNVFSPLKDFFTTKKEKLSPHVKFYHSDSQLKKTFHAKFYEFNYGNDSIVYWGSANCSYSGLLNSNRNYEFLIKCQMSKEEIYQLWGTLDIKEEGNVEYGQQPNENNDLNNKPAIYIKGITASEEDFTIHLNKQLNKNTVIKGIINNGTIVDFKITSKNGEIIKAACDEKGLVVLYLEQDNEKISNFIYINNPYALQARITGKQDTPNLNPKEINNSKVAATQAFGFFNLEKDKNKRTNLNPEMSRNGFWRLPRFKSRTHLSRIINLESFVKQRVIKLKEKNDNENPNESAKTEKSQITNQPKNLLDSFTRETNKLLKNINLLVKEKRLSEIEISRWLQGIDIINYYILNYLDEIEQLPHDIKEFIDLFTNISRISSWVLTNLLDDTEQNKERIELIKTVQDVLLGFSIYNLLYSQRFTTSKLSANKNDKFIANIKRTLYLQHIISNKFPEFEKASEHSQLTYEAVMRKLPNLKRATKTIEILNNKKINKLKDIETVDVYSNKMEPLLLININGNQMNLETILGDLKRFTANAPLTKQNILI